MCPAGRSQSAGALFGVLLALTIAGCVAYAIRRLLPIDILKLGLSMIQVRWAWPAPSEWE